MYHLAVIPIFSPVFVEAYEAATGLYLDEDHINLATWHNVLISLAIARKTGNREEEAWTLETARRLPVFLVTPSCAGRSLRSLGFRRIRGAGAVAPAPATALSPPNGIMNRGAARLSQSPQVCHPIEGKAGVQRPLEARLNTRLQLIMSQRARLARISCSRRSSKAVTMAIIIL